MFCQSNERDFLRELCNLERFGPIMKGLGAGEGTGNILTPTFQSEAAYKYWVSCMDKAWEELCVLTNVSTLSYLRISIYYWFSLVIQPPLVWAVISVWRQRETLPASSQLAAARPPEIHCKIVSLFLPKWTYLRKITSAWLTMLQYLCQLTMRWKTTEPGQRIQKNVLGNCVLCNINED